MYVKFVLSQYVIYNKYVCQIHTFARSKIVNFTPDPLYTLYSIYQQAYSLLAYMPSLGTGYKL